MTTHFFAALALATSLGCQEAPQAPAPEAVQPVTASAPAAPAEPREPVSADQAYERGRQLMEKHCGDCYQRSTEGVLAAVEALQQAIALGRNDADVHHLLRDAYNGLAYIDYRHDDARRRPYEELLHQEIRVLAKLDPADLENRMRYVEILASPAEKIAELNAILAKSPKHAAAHYRLAQLLAGTSDVDRAAAHARRWLETADPVELSEYSGRLFEGVEEERLRRMLAIDRDLHPASFELARQAIQERQDIRRGVELARASLQEAPPIVANEYLPVFTNLLNGLKKPDEAASLRRDFEPKARTGRAQKQQFQ
jgi:hypothetical protein